MCIGKNYDIYGNRQATEQPISISRKEFSGRIIGAIDPTHPAGIRPSTEKGIQSVPVPSPLPSPTPSKTESAVLREQRRQRVASLRYGLLSTIKTSPQGVTNSLTPPARGKENLGE